MLEKCPNHKKDYQPGLTPGRVESEGLVWNLANAGGVGPGDIQDKETHKRGQSVGAGETGVAWGSGQQPVRGMVPQAPC